MKEHMTLLRDLQRSWQQDEPLTLTCQFSILFFFQRPWSGETIIHFHIYEHMIQYLDTVTCKHCFTRVSMGESSQHLLHTFPPGIVFDSLILKVIFTNLQPF